MKIVTTRRISQVFFFLLFLWFCVITTFGEELWMLRGWPVNGFLQLDPLVAIGTMLTTHTLYKPLAWALVTVVLTVIFGRFFCGWLCPFGSLHHFVGFLGSKGKTTAIRIKANTYRKAQTIKYYILIVFLISAAVPVIANNLQTGLLDPIPLVTRSFNLVLLPIADVFTNTLSPTERFYDGAGLILFVFFVFLSLNLVIPRFYCRFICPLGALFGIMSRFAIWRVGKNTTECSDCKLCERNCEGGCTPAGEIKISECVLCFNCWQDCKDELIAYQTCRSLAGEITNPDISRRGFVLSLFGGVMAIPAVRLSGKLASNWNNKTIRPPGSLAEEEFLDRCIKCGQCMRICPTNVIQPNSLSGGLEGLWTPILNNRIGSSGCQLNCVACGYICPTAAIRPITLAEKLGKNEFKKQGPVKTGTAFVDRSRCLPWAMDKACIVCQENCPVSPKAIYTKEYFNTIRGGRLEVKHSAPAVIEVEKTDFEPDQLATGDYYLILSDNPNDRRRISENTKTKFTLSLDHPWKAPPAIGRTIEIQIRLQRPYIDIDKCIGCGICEHECPVSGQRAIRVSAEGETRNPKRSLLL